MEQEEHSYGHDPHQDLVTRVYHLEKDLVQAYSRIAELEIQLLALDQVKIARCQLYTDVLMEKVDAIGDAVKHIIKDLIAEDKEREKRLPPARKIKIIRRQRLPPLCEVAETSDDKAEETIQ